MTNQRRTTRGTRSSCANAVLEMLESRRLLAAELFADVDDTGGDALTRTTAMVEYKEQLYFFPQAVAHDPELWRTDGTPGGTVMVKESSPGIGGVNPAEVEVTNGLMFYASGQLWRSDGTNEGTFALAAARSGASTIEPVGDTLLFLNPAGDELWKTDGTPAGTQLLQAFAKSPSTFQSTIGGLTRVGNTAFFWANEGTRYRLWRSDGTVAGTRVADASRTWSAIDNLTAVGGQLAFYGDPDALWFHAPTTGGSWQASSSADNFMPRATAVGNTLFFRGFDWDTGYELRRTNGIGSTLVRDIAAGFASSDPNHLTAFGGKLYFAAHDAAGTYGLWGSEPTGPADATLVKSFVDSSGRAIISSIRAIGDRLYIGVQNDVLGDSMWVSDGTAAGTSKIAQLPPRGLLDVPAPVEAGGTVYFGAQDGATGRELWKTDGTPAGTGLVADLGTAARSGFPVKAFEANGLSYFTAVNGALGYGLWRTDGTPAGTFFLGQPLSEPRYLGEVGQTIFFSATTSEHGKAELWRTDGTAAGTRLVKDVMPGYEGSRIERAAVLDGVLYFDANLGGRQQLWKSDGTEAGTVQAMDLRNTGLLVSLVSNGDHLLMSHSGKLWRSDGTQAGTTLVESGRPDATLSGANQLTVTDKGVFFTSGSGGLLSQIWLTDGTTAGTRPVGDRFSNIVLLDYAEGQLFFAANDGVHGQELWRTDGTDDGTVMLADARTGPAGQFFSETSVFVFGQKPWIMYDGLMLVQFLNASGRWELWRSDGTPAGTYELPLPGAENLYFIPSMAIVGGLAYVADTRSIWSTDGTIGGTKLLDWQAPGGQLFVPNDLMSANGNLLFRATETSVGSELWKLDVPDAVTITGTAADDHWTIGRISSTGSERIGVWGGGRGPSDPPDYAWDVDDLASIRFDGLGGDDTLFVAGEAPFPVAFNGGAGSDTFGAVSSTPDVSGDFDTLEVLNGARLGLRDDASLDRIHLSSGATLVLRAGAGIIVRTKTLVLDATRDGDTIDVNDNTLIFEGGDLAAVEALVAAGRNGETRWLGNGIRSTAAANNPMTGLAIGRDGDDVVVKYTYNGDANLDGTITSDDYFRIDSSFLAQPTSPTYAQGDFNYDEQITSDDYFLIDSAFLGQGAPLAAAGASPLTAVVVDSESKARRVRAPGVWEDSAIPARKRHAATTRRTR